MRRYFVAVWSKALAGLPLQPMERIIADVIAMHPEYHALLNPASAALERDYTPEGGQTNPFLHMGMHIALREQLGANRPAGIGGVYQALQARHPDEHTAQHAMLDCLGEMLMLAQRNAVPPDEAQYLHCLRRRAGLAED